MNHWKALYVASRTEKKVYERLVEQSFNAYLPLRKTIKQWSDRKKRVVEPMIRGYVFIQIKETERLKVLQIPGVVNFVRNLGADAVIKSHEIETLKNVEALGYDVQLFHDKILPGETVKIIHGPLKGLSAKVLDVHSDGKVYGFIIEGLGQCLKVKIPQDILENNHEF